MFPFYLPAGLAAVPNPFCRRSHHSNEQIQCWREPKQCFVFWPGLSTFSVQGTLGSNSTSVSSTTEEIPPGGSLKGLGSVV